MMPVFTSDIAHGLKLTLDKVATDKTTDVKTYMSRFFDEGPMSDNFEDDLDVAGMGLASTTPEGQEISVGTIKEGALNRYIAQKVAIRMIVTEEALEDSKYEDIIQAGKRTKRSMIKTFEVDAALQLARGFNSTYSFGDGQPVWSSSHTLAQGGTFSNTMATPMSPSRVAMMNVRAQALKLPDYAGIVEGYLIKKIVCPVDQVSVWEGIVMSTHAPEPGAFNEINVVNQTMDLAKADIIANPYWDNTTTNWAVFTEAELGFRWKWRRKIRSRSWVENSQELMQYAISARYARGMTNPRCSIGSNS